MADYTYIKQQIAEKEARLKTINESIPIGQAEVDTLNSRIKENNEEMKSLNSASAEYKSLKAENERYNAQITALKYQMDSDQSEYFDICRSLAGLYDTQKELDNVEEYKEIAEEEPLLVEREVVPTISESTQQLDKLYEINLYVYIAGVYIPVLGVNIGAAFSGMPTATIDVPPDPLFLGIGREDRVPVQIFIKDTFSNTWNNRDIPGLMSYLQNNLVEYDKYISTNKIQNNRLLLFSGEIVSYSYSSTPSGRYISLQCESDITFINDIKIVHDSSINPLVQAWGMGNSTDTIINITPPDVFPLSLFMFGLTVNANINGQPVQSITAPEPPADKPSVGTTTTASTGTDPIKVPGDFMDNLMTFLQVGDMQEKSSLVEYYHKHSNQLQLNNRYVKIPFFDNASTFNGSGFPILSALKDLKTIEYIGRIADLAPTTTVFDYINYMASNMEYDFAVQGSPTLVTGSGAPRLAQILFKPMLYEALPPACNIIQKEHLIQVNFSEQVRGVPTRVIGQNVSGTAQMIGATSNTVINAMMNMIYPPQLSDEIQQSVSQNNAKPQNYTTPALMDGPIVNELYTGPYVHRFALPGWLDFLSKDNTKSYTDGDDKISWAKHHWTMMRAEYRTVNINMAFNPYLVVGAPAVVLDGDVFEGFSLVGYVISVSHSINKNNATTQVVLNFPRTLEEESDPDKRLENTVPTINKTVTHNKNKMDILYNYIYGCNSYDYLESNTFKNNGNNPRKAYRNNYRKICTLEQFYDFLATDMYTNAYTDWRSTASKTELHREIIYKEIKLKSLSDRRDNKLVKNLKALQDRLLHTDIYT